MCKITSKILRARDMKIVAKIHVSSAKFLRYTHLKVCVSHAKGPKKFYGNGLTTENLGLNGGFIHD